MTRWPIGGYALAVAAAVPGMTGDGAMASVTRGPIVRMAELEIDPDQLAAYRAMLTEEIETSVRVEPGVLSLNAVSIKGDPAHIRILEVYADQAAYEAHLRTPHFLTYKTGTATMVRSLRLIETDPILLRSKAAGGDVDRP
jgi:quinol monooxygenase YgiN